MNQSDTTLHTASCIAPSTRGLTAKYLTQFRDDKGCRWGFETDDKYEVGQTIRYVIGINADGYYTCRIKKENPLG